MNIAILGIRGVPANYGGFETFAEQLGRRLAGRGHQVTVYGRSTSVPRGLREYQGMRIVRLPAPHAKYFETVVHSLYAAVHAATQPFDVVYVCNSANVPAAIVLLAARKRVVLNVDGLEWKRAKWGTVGKTYYRVCAFLAAHLPVHLVTDARVIQAYYKRAYGAESRYFPYGAELVSPADDGTLAQLSLEPSGYVLYVSRLEPENNAHIVIDAYQHVRTDLPLVIVGDAPYAHAYVTGLRRSPDARVRFVGAIYGPGYLALRSNAALYVQATEVGGTHPALIEAMASGNAIVANDVPEHREALGDSGRYYSSARQLTDAIQDLLDDPQTAHGLGEAARRRAGELYSWDQISDDYERWFRELIGEASDRPNDRT
jgi:glycosyltransferase involved in cell wall biosynthesis